MPIPKRKKDLFRDYRDNLVTYSSFITNLLASTVKSTCARYWAMDKTGFFAAKTPGTRLAFAWD
jgi:hypothetical protein